MTTHRRKRCRHCRTVYAYQGSGHGCGDELNDSAWCPTCKGAIVEALKAVPKRFEKVLVSTTEQNALELETLQESKHRDRPVTRSGLITAPLPEGALPIYDKDPDVAALVTGDLRKLTLRRVEVGLLDLEDPSNKDKRGRVKVDGKMYLWNYWPKDPEGTGQVRVEMERDLATGEEVPWENYG